MGTRSSSDTNTGPPIWQVQIVAYARAPGWEVAPETQSKLCSLSNLSWCGALSAGRKVCLFSNWHKGIIWVSSSPFQTLGVSALWPSFQGLPSPSLFQSISICFNKYLIVPTLYQHWVYTDEQTGTLLALKKLVVYWRSFHLSFFMVAGELSFGEAWADLSPCSLRHEILTPDLESTSWDWEVMTTTHNTHVSYSRLSGRWGHRGYGLLLAQLLHLSLIKRRKKKVALWFPLEKGKIYPWDLEFL